VVVGNVTFLWYLLFSMCYSLHVTVFYIYFTKCPKLHIDRFYRATCNHVTQRTVLLSQFCLSIRLSARPSVRCAYCDKTKWCTAGILIPHETAVTSFLIPTVVGARRPVPSEICAQSDPAPSKNADFDFRL